MDNNQLISLIKQHRDNSLGSLSGELSNERAEALDHYHGRPYGNEIEGRSQVVSKDLSETVDWLISYILKVLLQSGSLAEFTPMNDNDIDAAEQETDYVNQVIMTDNNGYLILHDILKDTLLLKNGYVKHWWDESEKIEETEYNGLSGEQMVMLIQEIETDPNVTVDKLKQEARVDVVIDEQGQAQEIEVFDIKLKITRKLQKLIIEPTPTEEIRVSKKARGSTQDSPFTEHFGKRTRSELIEMGMKKEFVDNLPRSGETKDSESNARNTVNNENDEVEVGDTSMEEVDFSEAYIRVDYDDDGIAELRKVISAGDKIPEGDEWNEVVDAVNITGAVVKRMPHRHVGESLDDELADLQEINTIFFRNMLDNIFQSTNQQYIVNERVVLEDFLITLPGGVKRVEGTDPVNGSVEPVVNTPLMAEIMPAIEHVERLKHSRTGIDKNNGTGIDPNILKEMNNGTFNENVSRTSAKVENYVRMFAETCAKELVLQVHSILRKNQDIPRTVRLRGKFVQVNPSEWKERTNLTLKVGLGTGTEEEKRDRLNFLVMAQEKAAAAGIVSPKNVFNMFSDLAKTVGKDTPTRYIMEPGSDEHQQFIQGQSQDESNPLAEAEQVKAQALIQVEQMKSQLKGQIESAHLQQKQQFEMQKNQLELLQRALDRESDEDKAVLDAEVKMAIAGLQQDIAKQGMGAGLQDG